MKDASLPRIVTASVRDVPIAAMCFRPRRPNKAKASTLDVVSNPKPQWIEVNRVSYARGWRNKPTSIVLAGGLLEWAYPPHGEWVCRHPG